MAPFIIQCGGGNRVNSTDMMKATGRREATTVWPDLAKFRQFGKIFKVLGNFLRVYLLFGNILDQLWQI